MRRTRKDVANIDCIGRLIKAAGRTVGGYDPDQLARLSALRRTVDEAMLEAVKGQRSQGVTWSSIGEALGVTKQAVIQAFGPELRNSAQTTTVA